MINLIYVIFQASSQANGGLESATQLIAQLPSPPIIVTHQETRYTAKWRDLGADVRVWAEPSYVPDPQVRNPLRKGEALARWNARVAALVGSSRARVVQCNDITALWHCAIGARAAGARVIFNVRDMFDESRSYGLKWRAIHHLADDIVCLSEEMRGALTERCRPILSRAASMSVIYSVVDLDQMRPLPEARRTALREEGNIAEGAFEIVHVGRFCEKKDQLGFIVDAMPSLVASVPFAHVTFVGDFEPDTDAYANRCLEEVKRRGLDANVTFAGFSRDPQRFYQAADVTCLTSRFEGLPRAMIESLACGTPVVAFDVTSVREFLDERRCGVCVDRGDWPALVRALSRLATDARSRAEMGTTARTVAESFFAAGEAVTRYEQLYRRLASRHP